MDIKQLGIMKNREEAFACFKDLYEYYLYKKLQIEVALFVEDYINDGVKFHIWKIAPVDVNGHGMITKIQLSDASLNEILMSLDKSDIETVVKLNEDIINVSLKY